MNDIRKLGAMLVACLTLVTFGLIACDGDSPTGGLQFGTLRVTVTGHAAGLPNAGALQAVFGDSVRNATVPVSGTLEQLAPVGTYTLTYTPPTGYTMATGQQAQRSVTINPGAVTDVTFAVVQPTPGTGTVRITVTGLAAGAANGGSATVVRTDATQTPITVNIPTAGSADAQATAGTYRVTYTAPSGYQTAPGQTNPQNITVGQGTIATAAFQVQAIQQPPPSGGTVLFFSDWRTRSGTTAEAMSDGGKWNSLSAGHERNGSIIDAPSSFPTHKVLRVASDGTREGWLAPTVSTLGEIPVGTTRNYRWYHAFHEPATADRGQHPIQDGGAISQSNWFMSTTNGGSNLSSTQWGLDYAFGGNPVFNTDKFTLGTREFQFTALTKGQVYRHEVQVARISATQFRFHAWVFDAAGNLLYDDDDFRARDGTSTLANHVHTFQSVANTGIFLIGLNGIGNNPPWPIHSSDQAGIAIVQGLPERQPIGAYGSVQGEVRR